MHDITDFPVSHIAESTKSAATGRSNSCTIIFTYLKMEMR